jgi:hypothetical protein
MAFEVYSRAGGFSPWVGFTSGAYLAHLDAARAAVEQAGLPLEAPLGAPAGPCLPFAGTAGAVAPPYSGGATGCRFPDPTGTGGCVAGSTAWALAQTFATFGAWPSSCWDEHAWNPRSDHPRGLGCDFTVGRLGAFPGAEDRARGWQLAEWLLANARPLSVTYVIFDGRYCPAGGACRPYTGGGVYDAGDATGGHFDHVHASFRDASGSPA